MRWKVVVEVVEVGGGDGGGQGGDGGGDDGDG